jgi:hypothetical protein
MTHIGYRLALTPTQIGTTMTHDLYAEVKQSASDEIVESASYPLTVLEKRQAFPGCTKLAATMATEEDAPFYKLTKAEMRDYLKEAVEDVSKSQASNDVSVAGEIYSFCGEIIQQAQHIIEVASSAKSDYEGPDVKDLQRIVESGIEGLVDTLGDWGMYAWCPYLRVIVEKKPNIRLASPRIDLNGIDIKVTATGELWAKYPWWNCSRLCTKWNKVNKCERIASITVSPKMKAEAYADLCAEAAKVIATGKFDKLRLNCKILDKIPLERIANNSLKDKLLYAFDAGKFVATVPLLESMFSVNKITLPPSTDGLNVGIELKQI